MVLAVYSTLLLVVLIGGLPWWLLRMATSGRYRAGLAGRLGLIPPALRQSLSNLEALPLIWLHAVSVGEVLAAASLVRALEDAGYAVAVSTTTQAGQELARTRFPGSPVFYMPLDLAFTVRRYLDLLKPHLVLTMESELWPRLIHECFLRRIPLCVANARVSDRSFPRYLRLRPLWSPFLCEVTLFLAQSEETVRRLIQMGASPRRVVFAGNLKYDLRPASENAMTVRVSKLLAGKRLVVAGSTLPGEEAALLTAWKTISAGIADVQLLIAPRHTPRFDEVATLIREQGHKPLHLSTLSEPSGPLEPSTILLLDTIGDLAAIYSTATVAFLGGSLVPKGGHNPLEPAQFGVPVVMGESYENFREIVEGMRAADAIRIVGQAQLAATITALLDHPTEAQQSGERGRSIFESQAGATERTIACLQRILQASPAMCEAIEAERSER